MSGWDDIILCAGKRKTIFMNHKDNIWFCYYQLSLYLVTECSIVIGFTVQILSWFAIRWVAEFALFPCLVYVHYMPSKLAGGSWVHE